MTVPTVWIVMPLAVLMTALVLVPVWMGLTWIERQIGDMYLRRNGFHNREHFEQVRRELEMDALRDR